MRAPSAIAIAILALTTLGGAALAWHQYQELIALRAAAMDPNERAELQKRIWELQKANRGLTDELATLRNGASDVDTAIAEATSEPAPNRERGPRGGRGGRGAGAQPAAVRSLLAKPEVQALIQQQRKLAIGERYSSLIRNLNLSPEQADKLKTLLADRQTSMQDVLAAARDHGIDPRSDPEGFRKLMADTRTDLDNGLKALLGESGFAQLQTYEQTVPQRALVDQIQSRLTNAGNPLTSAQADQLVGILAANSGSRPASGGEPEGPGFGRGDFGGGFGGRRGEMAALAGVFLGGGGFGGATAITPTTINQAQGVLSQSQLAVLQEIQQQQQQTQQLRQLVGETLRSNDPARNGGDGAGTNPSLRGNRGRGGGR